MTLHLLLHTLRHRRLAIFWFTVGLFILSLLVMALWPSSRDLDLDAFLETMPDAAKAAFLGRGFDSPAIEQSAFLQYLGSQLTTWLPILAAYYGMWAGGGAIARAYGRHTLDVLLAQPISRERFLLTRLAAVALGALVIVVGAMIGLLLGVAAWAGDTPIPAGDIVLVHVQLLLFGMACAAIAAVVATVLLEPGRTYGVSALIVVVMYVLFLVAEVVEPLEWLGYVSLFHYWRPLEQFSTGEFAWTEAVVLAAVAVVAAGLAVVLFRRRDIVT